MKMLYVSFQISETTPVSDLYIRHKYVSMMQARWRSATF